MSELKAGSATGPRSRPLSPHLQIYRPMLTMMMSIVHRITGTALYFGILLLAWWLISAAAGPNAYANVEWFIGSLIGRIVLFGYTWALLHHMLGGIRHLIWDTLHGLEPVHVLLRRVDDRGVVAVLDSRMATAGYGGYLRASLPPFWTTTDPAVVKQSLQRLR